MDKYRKIMKPKEERTEDETEIRVTSMGSVSAYISRAAKVYGELCKTQVVIKGTGNALTKAVTTAEVIKRRFKGLHQITNIGSIEVEDEYEPLEEGLDKVTEIRHLPFVEITLSKNALDTKDKGYQAPLDESLITEVDAEEMMKPRGRGKGGGRGKGKGKGKGKDDSKGKGKGKGKGKEVSEPKGKGKGKGKEAKGKGKGKGKEEPKGKAKGKGKGKEEPKGKGKGKGKRSYSDDWEEPKGKGKGKGKGKRSYSDDWEEPKGKGKGKGKGKSEPKGKGKSKGKSSYTYEDDWYGSSKGKGKGKGKSNSWY